MATVREVELPGRCLRIVEHSSLENQAGAVVWDCALVLTHFLHHPNQWVNPELVRGRRVVELGSGTGLVGLSMALLGAGQVVLTDLEEFLPGLDRNIKENGLTETVTAQALSWGEPVDLLLPPPDFILASDVIYAHDTVEKLTETLLGLCGPNTKIVLAYELRAGSTEWVQQMKRRGLRFRKLPNTVLHPDWRAEDIGIFIGGIEDTKPPEL